MRTDPDGTILTPVHMPSESIQAAEDILVGYAPKPWPADVARAIAALKGYESTAEMLADYDSLVQLEDGSVTDA